jgi:hypothetical protein
MLSLFVQQRQSEKMTTHDLLDFMQTATKEMQDEYKRIQKRSQEDPGTAGDQGEENWATLLRDWLPPAYQIVTKGRILGDTGKASPQVDVLVLRPSYPKKLLDKKLYMAGGVATAFECKLTLRSEHFQKVFENSRAIQNLALPRSGTAYNELHSPIIYGLLAHSHIWKADPVAKINNLIKEQDRLRTQHPREMIDLVCVANLASWVAMKGTYQEIRTWYSLFGLQQQNGQRQQLLQQTPIGSLITYLLIKLAWEDPSLRDIDRYFYRAKAAGPALGTFRQWNESVVTENTAEKIKSINVDLQNSTQEVPDQELRKWWDQWQMVFP